MFIAGLTVFLVLSIYDPGLLPADLYKLRYSLKANYIHPDCKSFSISNFFMIIYKNVYKDWSLLKLANCYIILLHYCCFNKKRSGTGFEKAFK